MIVAPPAENVNTQHTPKLNFVVVLVNKIDILQYAYPPSGASALHASSLADTFVAREAGPIAI